MPCQFVPYGNFNDVYKLKSIDVENSGCWVTKSASGGWLYSNEANESFALPVKFIEKEKNHTGSFIGKCYHMVDFSNDTENKHIGFNNDGQWVRCCYSDKDCIVVKLYDHLNTGETL